MEASDRVGGVEHDLDWIAATSRNFECAVNRHAGVVDFDDSRAGDGHTVDADEHDSALGVQCVLVANPDQPDRGIGKQHARGEWVDVSAFEAGRTLTKEDFQVLASE